MVVTARCNSPLVSPFSCRSKRTREIFPMPRNKPIWLWPWVVMQSIRLYCIYHPVETFVFQFQCKIFQVILLHSLRSSWQKATNADTDHLHRHFCNPCRSTCGCTPRRCNCSRISGPRCSRWGNIIVCALSCCFRKSERFGPSDFDPTYWYWKQILKKWLNKLISMLKFYKIVVSAMFK